MNFYDPPQPTFRGRRTTIEWLRVYLCLKWFYFIHESTDLSHFLYIFGGEVLSEDENPLTSIKWQDSIFLLAYLIDNLFEDTEPRRWKLTEQYFTINGTPPKAITLKHAPGRYENWKRNNWRRGKPKRSDVIDWIIFNSLSQKPHERRIPVEKVDGWSLEWLDEMKKLLDHHTKRYTEE
jgi:hypothetical protein